MSKNKTFLVTGANRGIGLAIVKQLAKECPEDKILLGSRSLVSGQKEADQLASNVEAVKLDLSSPVVLEEDLKRISSTLGHVDCLINNAGVLFEDSAMDISDELFDEVFQINVRAAFTISRHFLPEMINRNFGRIVNMSSGWGAFSGGLSGPFSYSFTKASLNALTLTLSQQLPKSIKVNSMCPGWVRTRMGGEAASRSPEEGADTAFWLATLPDSGPTGGFFRDREPIDW